VSYLRLIFETFYVLSRCRYATLQWRKPTLSGQIPLDYSDPKLYRKPVVHTRKRVGLFWFLKPNEDKVVSMVTDAE
jgi:hypothetical protein